ncbi:hypothetical protein [Pendulispora albinea]|uniref:Holin n=1 Tax=Pendulispora albinea TaxID=2741071 RepID=A0ABZ2LT54_9BACT
MTDTGIDTILALALDGKWTLVSAIVIGAIVRAFKSDTSLPTLPPAWRPWLALVLGAISGIAQTVVERNVTWKEAIVSGLTAAFTAMAGHDLLIGSLRKGRELGEGRVDDARPQDPGLVKGGAP